MKKRISIFIFLLLLVVITGCQPNWTITLNTNSESRPFNREEFNNLIKRFPDNEYCEGLLLEQVFYEEGIEIINSINVTTETGDQINFPWEASAESLCLNSKGELINDDQTYMTNEIKVSDLQLPSGYVRIVDIPATVLNAFGLAHDDIPGNVLADGIYEHVVLLFLDGFGFEKFRYAVENGIIGTLTNSGEIYQGITVYPPRTVTGSAAVLTGLFPKENGVDRGTIRKTDALTLFDRTEKAGIPSAAIEGDALAFNLRNTDVELSGDRDLNGGTDDNVFANAMDTIGNNMPNLLWIHFHGIDDFGHTYGSDDPKVDSKITEINDYLEQIYSALPEDTLIIYFADHGMHNVNEEGRLGNHGHLIYEDMVIPVIIQTK